MIDSEPELWRYRCDEISIRPIDHSAPIVGEAYAELIAAGDHLADLSAQNRQLVRQKGTKADKLRTDFLDARARYGTAFQATAELYVTNMRSQGAGDQQIRAAVIPYTVGLHSQITSKELGFIHPVDSQQPRLSPLLSQVHEQAAARAASDNARLKLKTDELVTSTHTPESAIRLVGQFLNTLLLDRIIADQLTTTKRTRSVSLLGACATLATTRLWRKKPGIATTV
jgi:hypothetical protein